MSGNHIYARTDLHLHLDGSLSPEVILELGRKQGIELPAQTPEELIRYVSVDLTCESLNEYLKCFDLPLLLLQTKEALELASYDLVKRLEQQGLYYAEIRYAPQLHCEKGMSQEQAVCAVLKGADRAMAEGGINVQFILCCMRGDMSAENAHDRNLETVALAGKYIGKGVAAIDLAGAEGLFPTEDYEEEFALAKKQKVPFTIHAGEAAGPESIWKALEFGVSRIGHGVRAIKDAELMRELIKRKIPLEMCPVSNLQTKAVKSLGEYPLRTYLEQGMIVTVNSDNMTVSGTSAEREYDLLRAQYGLTEEEAEMLALNGAKAAFLPQEEKEKLAERIICTGLMLPYEL